MNYLKKEMNKLLPFSLLFGAIGGVLLILVNNLMTPSILAISLVYTAGVGGSVYLLNNMRYRKDTPSSILYGYMVFLVMTLISLVDTLMSTNRSMHNPLFESVLFFALVCVGVLVVAGGVSILTNRRTLS
jgi:drug/metabolite transporter (DMT)-like permease